MFLPRAAIPLPVPRHDPAQVRAAARAIANSAEFRPPRQSWWSAAYHWVLREVGKLVGHLMGLGGGSRAAAWVTVAVLAAVVALAGYVAVRLWVRMPAEASSPVVVTTATTGRSAVDWRAQAARHERDGRWRDALRCRYRALVADLARRGVVSEVPGRTAGEYRDTVRFSAPGIARDFGRATALFEDAWYGDRPTGPGDQTDFDELAGRVLTSVAAGRR